MLYFPQTRIDISKERPLAIGARVLAEGQALGYFNQAGSVGVAPMNAVLPGASLVGFAGVSFNGVMNSAFDVPFIEQIVVGAGPSNGYGTVGLAFQPSGAAGTTTYPSVFVFDQTTNAVVNASASVVAPTAVAAGDYIVDSLATGGSNSKQLDVNAARIGHTLLVAYRYSPTVQQWVFTQGMELPGGPSGPYLGQTDTVQRGDVYTSEFDTQVNWAAYAGGTIGVNKTTGLFTYGLGSNQIDVPQVTFITAPGVNSPFLGLAVNAA